VAYVGEKLSFGAVNLGQSLRAFALFFVRARTGNGRRHRRFEQVVEGLIGFIQREAGTYTGDEHADGMLAAWR
jgi:hypothetical protein